LKPTAVEIFTIHPVVAPIMSDLLRLLKNTPAVILNKVKALKYLGKAIFKTHPKGCGYLVKNQCDTTW
jgi:hypothetical protein